MQSALYYVWSEFTSSLGWQYGIYTEGAAFVFLEVFDCRSLCVCVCMRNSQIRQLEPLGWGLSQLKRAIDPTISLS